MLEKILKTIACLAAISIVGYVFYTVPKSDWFILYNKYFPCTRPIEYSLSTFDSRFKLSKADFLQVTKEAEAIWEKSIDKNLFEYKERNDEEAGDLKLNLIYDYRQEATLKIKSLGVAVSDTRASYDNLKQKYDALEVDYKRDKANLQQKVEDFKERQDAYNEKVAYWNKKGGAPNGVYQELNIEGSALKAEAAEIHKMENNLNAEAADINALVVVINRLAQTLNLNAAELNAIGKERGEEFTEGEYKSSILGRAIDVYEFSTKDKLRRLLAHELGHAIGLDHVEDPTAIMYRLNESKKDALSEADLTALKAYCGIK